MNFNFFVPKAGTLRNTDFFLANDGDFDEGKHPRGQGGKFGSGGGAGKKKPGGRGFGEGRSAPNPFGKNDPMKQRLKTEGYNMSERHHLAAQTHEAEAKKGGKDAAGHIEGAKKHRAAAEAHAKGEADAHHKSGLALEHHPGVVFPGKQVK
jgi:hypothetical protein